MHFLVRCKHIWVGAFPLLSSLSVNTRDTQQLGHACRMQGKVKDKARCHISRGDGGTSACVARCRSQCGHFLAPTVYFPPSVQIPQPYQICYCSVWHKGWPMTFTLQGPSWRGEITNLFIFKYMFFLKVHYSKRYVWNRSHCFLNVSQSLNSGLLLGVLWIVFFEAYHTGDV